MKILRAAPWWHLCPGELTRFACRCERRHRRQTKQMKSGSFARLENMNGAQQAHRICACRLRRLPLLKKHWLSAPGSYFLVGELSSKQLVSVSPLLHWAVTCHRSVGTPQKKIFIRTSPIHRKSLRHQESIHDLFSGIYPIRIEGNATIWLWTGPLASRTDGYIKRKKPLSTTGLADSLHRG